MDRSGKIVNRVLFWILVVFIIFYTVFPFFWAVSPRSSRTPSSSRRRSTTGPIRSIWTFYQFVLDNGDFLRALRNSVIVSVATVVISLALGSLAAYALGRLQVPGPDPGPLPDPVDDDVPADRHPRFPLSR